MSENTITCPACWHVFSLSDVQKHELDHMRAEMEKKIEAEVKQKAHEWAKSEVEKARKEEQEKSQKDKIELEDLRKRDEEARKKEIDYLKKSQELDQIKKNQELEIEKAKMEERKKVEEESKKQAEEKSKFETDKMKLEFEKREAELRKQLESTQKAVEEANRKANQGSMQIQWEIQEDALKSLLTMSFPIDAIADVEKGIEGADVIQTVRNELGQSAGVIAWESKNTKAWSDKWIDKLREDRLKVNASLSVIVTNVLPKDITHFWLYRDIWVTEWAYVLPLATLLRAQIIELTKTRNSLESKDEKMEVIYRYLISPEFKSKIENIVEAFRQMQEQVQKERIAFEAQWKKREQLLSQVMTSTSGFYGDLQGLIGASALPKVEYLEIANNNE